MPENDTRPLAERVREIADDEHAWIPGDATKPHPLLTEIAEALEAKRQPDDAACQRIAARMLTERVLDLMSKSMAVEMDCVSIRREIYLGGLPDDVSSYFAEIAADVEMIRALRQVLDPIGDDMISRLIRGEISPDAL